MKRNMSSARWWAIYVLTLLGFVGVHTFAFDAVWTDSTVLWPYGVARVVSSAVLWGFLGSRVTDFLYRKLGDGK